MKNRLTSKFLEYVRFIFMVILNKEIVTLFNAHEQKKKKIMISLSVLNP
jgi:hypothetical protein